MKKSKKDAPLNTDQTTRLLRLGLDSAPGPHDRQHDEYLRDLLLDMLSTKLPIDSTLKQALPDLLKSLSEELTTISGAPLAELLADPESKPTLLRHIKDHIKNVGASTENHSQREVSLVVYFGAIAAALVYHKSKITDHSYDDLRQSFETFSQQEWVTPTLQRLFKEALALCETKD